MKMLESVFFIAEFAFLIAWLILGNGYEKFVWLFGLLYLLFVDIRHIDESYDLLIEKHNITLKNLRLKYVNEETYEMIKHDVPKEKILKFIEMQQKIIDLEE